MARELTENDRALVADMVARARAAMAEIEEWSQKDGWIVWRRPSAGIRRQ